MAIIRKTKSVATLLEVFAQADQALSSVDLVNRMRGIMNKTTVYRILDRLEDEGVLHSFQGVDGLKWFAKCDDCSPSSHSDVHPHFQCQDCGKTTCLDIQLTVPDLPNLKVEHSQLLLIGQCEDCLR
ncbi:Fur family transcriptional regulator [Aureitalea marina]|uniref:Transcriptional regulator n=1 Tax=Aureitalea marina TaxID=930804 RepID=A0A2S7KSW2_9FLAO|nr:transcriptional repressor [Aureitalea marina]PQB05715.1 transcriptional regulator [Aureitalea marina]